MIGPAGFMAAPKKKRPKGLRRHCPKCRKDKLFDHFGIGCAQVKCGWCGYKERERLTELFK